MDISTKGLIENDGKGPKKKIRRIGVLTSGGDAPGMNAAIRAVVRNCIQNNIIPIGIHRGYNGLLNSDVRPLDARAVNRITSLGGTMLYTARCEEFKTLEGQKKGAEVCQYLGIDGIICIGGDGTLRGVEALSRLGVNAVGIPATIDNDISCTHYSIGFDTAANTAIDAIDKLADTMQSHERASVVEVMGRDAGHLALYVGLAVGATAILIPEIDCDCDGELVEKIRESRYNGKRHFLVIIAEGVGGASNIAEKIRRETGVETRVTTLGHVQRGGSPSARDRVMASRMGHFAVEKLVEGQTNMIVCYRNSQICSMPISEAFAMTKGLDEYMYRVAQDISI